MNPEEFFVRNQNIRPWVKIGLKGFDGGGKSLTAALIAIGLAKLIGTEKPVTIIDSEIASQFFLDEFESAGLPAPFHRPSESYADLLRTMEWMKDGLSDILIIDQISAFHKDKIELYKERPTLLNPPRPKRLHLEMDDRITIKDEWQAEFSRPFVKGEFHAIMCGRAGMIWENEFNEDAGRRESFTSGTKMRGDNETGHDPDLVVLLEFDEQRRVNTALVTKDRSRTIQGKVFDNPTFEDFLPFIEKVLRNPSTVRVTPAERSGLTFNTDESRQDYKRKCREMVEEIEGVLLHAIPGRKTEDTQHKMDILHRVFGTHSDQVWQGKSLQELQQGYELVKAELVARGYAELQAGRFQVKGMPAPVIEESGEGYEKITPKPLREAHRGLDRAQIEALWTGNDLLSDSRRDIRTLAKSAITFYWLPEQFKALLDQLKVDPKTHPKKNVCDVILMNLAKGPEATLLEPAGEVQQ